MKVAFLQHKPVKFDNLIGFYTTKHNKNQPKYYIVDQFKKVIVQL